MKSFCTVYSVTTWHETFYYPTKKLAMDAYKFEIIATVSKIIIADMPRRELVCAIHQGSYVLENILIAEKGW